MWILWAAAAAVTNAPVATTLDALRAQPQRFAGQQVRLRGQVDECWGFNCHLCPEEATPAAPQWQRCLALDFDRQRGAGRGASGANLDPIYRYATVELVAGFDPTCLKDAAGSSRQAIVVCTDRATVLRDARVRRVLLRRASAEGLLAKRERERLVDAPPETAAAVTALLRNLDRASGDWPRYRVFVSRSPESAKLGAVVCRSSGHDGNPGTWPLDFDSALLAPSSEDRFKCFSARKSDGGWVIEPD